VSGAPAPLQERRRVGLTEHEEVLLAPDVGELDVLRRRELPVGVASKQLITALEVRAHDAVRDLRQRFVARAVRSRR